MRSIPRSLSWIDPQRLALALVKAGVRPKADPRARYSWKRERALSLMSGPEPPRASGLAPGLRAPDWSAPRFEPPSGDLRQRLEAFESWIRTCVPDSQALFLVDDAGLQVLAKRAPEDLVSFASSLLAHTDKLRLLAGEAPVRGLSLEMANGRYLTLVRASTSMGTFALGLVSKTPVPKAQRDSATRGLHRVLNDVPAV